MPELTSFRKRRTAVYVRVSTTKASQKDSPEHQEGICREKSRQMDLEVLSDHVYEDRDTGTNIVSRPAIQELIKDAKKNKFDNVIFASLSRFSRDTMDSLALKRILVDSLGIRLISLDENFDSFIDTDELKFQIISAVNQKLSEQISISSKRGIRQSALKGNFIGTIPPYGYKKAQIGELKTLVPDEDKRKHIELIFRLYTSDKMGEKKIVNFLNQDLKIPSPKGGYWGITTIQGILQNEAYTGVNVFGKHESKIIFNHNDITDRKKVLVQKKSPLWERAHLPQTHEALITRELFSSAQEIRLLRGQGLRGGIRNRKNIFAGIIKCAQCNGSMVSMKSQAQNTDKQGREYRYLFCSRRRREGEVGCKNSYWLPYYSFKEDVLNAISKKISELTLAKQLFDKHKHLAECDNKDSLKELKLVQKQMESNRKMLFELRKEKMIGAVNEKQYEFEKWQYESELARLEKKAEEFGIVMEKNNDGNEFDAVKAALDDLVNLNYADEDDFEELRIILKKMIEKITVDRDGTVIVKTIFKDT